MTCARRFLTVAGVLMAVLAASTLHAGEPIQLGAADAARAALAPYLDAVAEYRSGRTGIATVRALAWTRSDINGFRQALLDRAGSIVVSPNEPGDIPIADLEVAALLHTEACLSFAGVGEATGASLHLDAAESMINWFEQLAALQPRLKDRSALVPRRDWYVAAVTALDGLRLPAFAETLAETAARDYPTDPGVLVAAAANIEARALVQEQLGELGEASGDSRRSGRSEPPLGRFDVLRFLEQRDPDRPGVRTLRIKALDYLARALAVEPVRTDARLRRGRLLAQVGREREAIAELEALGADAVPVEHQYLARLFLGGVHEAAGRPAEAASAYQQAMSLQPSAQTARVALAHAWLRAGRRDEAQTVLAPALDRNASPDLARDPFWSYPFGHPSRSRALLEALRDKVVR